MKIEGIITATMGKRNIPVVGSRTASIFPITFLNGKYNRDFFKLQINSIRDKLENSTRRFKGSHESIILPN
jgi:hypothetical protein